MGGITLVADVKEKESAQLFPGAMGPMQLVSSTVTAPLRLVLVKSAVILLTEVLPELVMVMVCGVLPLLNGNARVDEDVISISPDSELTIMVALSSDVLVPLMVALPVTGVGPGVTVITQLLLPGAKLAQPPLDPTVTPALVRDASKVAVIKSAVMVSDALVTTKFPAAPFGDKTNGDPATLRRASLLPLTLIDAAVIDVLVPKIGKKVRDTLVVRDVKVNVQLCPGATELQAESSTVTLPSKAVPVSRAVMLFAVRVGDVLVTVMVCWVEKGMVKRVGVALMGAVFRIVIKRLLFKLVCEHRKGVAVGLPSLSVLHTLTGYSVVPTGKSLLLISKFSSQD